jgi:hypothetical protein
MDLQPVVGEGLKAERRWCPADLRGVANYIETSPNIGANMRESRQQREMEYVLM